MFIDVDIFAVLLVLAHIAIDLIVVLAVRKYLMELIDKVDAVVQAFAEWKQLNDKWVELNVQQNNKAMAVLTKLVDGLAGILKVTEKRPGK